MPCDVTDYASCDAAFCHAIDVSPTKSLDIVALIAGVVGEPGSLVDQVLDARRKMEESASRSPNIWMELTRPPRPRHPGMDVNLLGVYDCAYLALWYMSLGRKAEVQKGKGKGNASDGQGKDVKSSGSSKEKTKSLILISSTVAYSDVPAFADYHTSKCELPLFATPILVLPVTSDTCPTFSHTPYVERSQANKQVLIYRPSTVGVRGLFRGLRHVTPQLNIRTNCLAPYFVRTPLVEENMSMFSAAGLEPGKGMSFVDVQTVADAAARCAVDEHLHGRVLAVVPGITRDACVDLCDDEDGLWAAEVFKMLVQKRRAVGDIM